MAKRTKKRSGRSAKKSLGKMSSTSKWIGTICLIAILIGGVVAILNNQGIINLGSKFEIDEVVTDGTNVVSFNVYDPNDRENEAIEDAQVTVYKLDTIEYTTAERAALEDDEEMDLFSEYTLDDAGDWDNIDFELEALVYWLAIVNLTGYDSVYLSSHTCAALGYPQVMEAGINSVQLVNSTESVAIIAYAINNGTGAALNTTDRDWAIGGICQDADGDLTNFEGFRTSYDFVTGVEDSLIIKIVFNTTADDDWAEFQNLGTVEYETSTTTLYIVLSNEIVNGIFMYSIEFDSGLNTEFEVVSIALGHVSADSFTQWDIIN
jgi:hypothetical protein